MAIRTPHIGLVKPAASELFSLDVLNHNSDIIDAALATAGPVVRPVYVDGRKLVMTSYMLNTARPTADGKLRFGEVLIG